MTATLPTTCPSPIPTTRSMTTNDSDAEGAATAADPVHLVAAPLTDHPRLTRPHPPAAVIPSAYP
jgi:hypothetical protein